MKSLKYVILGMAMCACALTFVAFQTGAFGLVADAMGAVVDRFGIEVETTADHGVRSSGTQSATDFRWSGRLAAGTALEVKGLNGSVTARRARGAEAVVTAELRGRRSDPATVRIEVLEHRDGVTLCAVYPTPDGKRENYCGAGSDGRMNSDRNDVQVEFFVDVPDGVDFIGRTVNGGIEALDLDGDVVAVTVNGDIELSTRGFAEAQTVNGSIDAEIGSPDVRMGAVFKTVNGSITLDLHDGIDADVRASWLNGGFESDLPFSLQGRLSRRSARGTLGDGGPELELSTVNGSIRIR